tara:strand:+ start:1241 stop:2101 length:861 start_codon:yes stop_codon:yes gene_type:complete
MIAFYIILVGSLVAINGSILGSFMMLRRMSMMCDAIVHAVLPGLVIAYLITTSRGSLAMMAGAIGSGILATAIIEYVQQKIRISSEAAIGLTFTTLFSIGIILLARFAGQVELDQDCVLFGELAYVPLDLWITDFGTNMGPYPIWSLGLLTVAVVVFMLVGYRHLLAATFDSEFAEQTGTKVRLWHYALMLMVSLFTVTSFHSVGAVMVMGFFILPPATAYLFTKNVRSLIAVACSTGVTCVILGYYVAFFFNVSIAGAIIMLNGSIFGVAAIVQSLKRIRFNLVS